MPSFRKLRLISYTRSNPAYREPLQIELRRYAQVQINIQSIVMRNKRTQRPVAGLFIVDCQRNTVDRVNVFAEYFDLTSAEARVLAQLISGKGLTVAARHLDIARSTARTHFCKHIGKNRHPSTNRTCPTFFRQLSLAKDMHPPRASDVCRWAALTYNIQQWIRQCEQTSIGSRAVCPRTGRIRQHLRSAAQIAI